MKKLLFTLLLILSTPAWATDSFGHVVAACGGESYKIGASGPLTVLGTGQLCSSTSGGSGSTTVNIDQTTPGTSNGVVVNSGGAIGEAQASPTANTVLDRLKTVASDILAATVALGQATMANSVPVTMASNQSAFPVTAAISTLGQAARSGSVPVTIADINSGEYENVAASQTAQVLGATGATGDYLLEVVCAPTSTSPGVVTILDNATGWTGGSFAGGTNSVSNLIPFTIVVNAYSVSGAWKLTTGANISCTGIGNFT